MFERQGALIIVTAGGTKQVAFEEAMQGQGYLSGEGFTLSSPVYVVPWTHLPT